jgi:hypothetical protein
MEARAKPRSWKIFHNWRQSDPVSSLSQRSGGDSFPDRLIGVSLKEAFFFVILCLPRFRWGFARLARVLLLAVSLDVPGFPLKGEFMIKISIFLPLIALAIGTSAWADSFVCNTFSNGQTFSAVDFNEFNAQQEAVAQCENNPYSNAQECMGDVSCVDEFNPGPGYPYPGPGYPYPYPYPGHPGYPVYPGHPGYPGGGFGGHPGYPGGGFGGHPGYPGGGFGDHPGNPGGGFGGHPGNPGGGFGGHPGNPGGGFGGGHGGPGGGHHQDDGDDSSSN